MKKFFEKNEILFSIFLIVLYVIPTSIFKSKFESTDFILTIWLLILSLFIILFIIKNKLGEYYGLNLWPNNKKFLYFFPLIIIISSNLWNGININNTKIELVCFSISMLLIGFIEEIIFRGFLFKSLEKENLNRAIIISSITFGIGHIVNLFTGAALLETLLQICYSMSIGFLFVAIFYKGKSLWPCIVTHGLVNAFSIYNINNNLSLYITPIILTIIPLVYFMYIKKVIK